MPLINMLKELPQLRFIISQEEPQTSVLVTMMQLMIDGETAIKLEVVPKSLPLKLLLILKTQQLKISTKMPLQSHSAQVQKKKRKRMTALVELVNLDKVKNNLVLVQDHSPL
jgi:hypothetical protein